MEKFCSSCGAQLNENQEVCLGCGKVLINKQQPKEKNHNTYITVTSIIMIILGVALVMNMSTSIMVFGIPGILGLVGGTLALNGKENKLLLLTSGIIYIIGAGINTIAIEDISLYGILAIIFGILNIIYSKQKSSN